MQGGRSLEVGRLRSLFRSLFSGGVVGVSAYSRLGT